MRHHRDTHFDRNNIVKESQKRIKKGKERFRLGNLGLFRLLVAVYNAGPDGISSYKLLHKLGSTNHAKAFIKRAEQEGLIIRKEGKAEHGHFPPVYNLITDKGIEPLKSLVP